LSAYLNYIHTQRECQNLRTLYMFRKVSWSIIRSLRLYMHDQVYSYVIEVLRLLASGNELEFHLVPVTRKPK